MERNNCSRTNIAKGIQIQTKFNLNWKKTIKKCIKRSKEKSYNNLKCKEKEIIKETEEETKKNEKRKKKYEKNKWN